MRHFPSRRLIVTIETMASYRVKSGRAMLTRGMRTLRQGSADALHLDQFVPYRLSVLTNTVSLSIAQAYEEQFGLSIPEWRVLAVVSRYPGISAIQVAERTAMDKVAVSRAVQSLLRAGRLVRTFHDGDRRRSVLELSAEGRRVYKRVVPLALGYQQKLLSALAPQDRRVFDRLLTRLQERAQQLA